MAEKDEVMKCLDVTTSLVLTSIQSGKFDAKDGQSVADFFGKIYGEVCDCANLTTPDFVEKWNARRKRT